MSGNEVPLRRERSYPMPWKRVTLSRGKELPQKLLALRCKPLFSLASVAFNSGLIPHGGSATVTRV